MRYGFAIDQRTCIGCHACTVACKTEHEFPVGQFRTCLEPACVVVCPTHSIWVGDLEDEKPRPRQRQGDPAVLQPPGDRALRQSARQRIMEGKQPGAKLIVVDPRMSNTSPGPPTV